MPLKDSISKCRRKGNRRSESLLRFVADESDLAIDLGIKGKSGIIEIWFSILVRKLLKRGNFVSVADLKAKVLKWVRSLFT